VSGGLQVPQSSVPLHPSGGLPQRANKSKHVTGVHAPPLPPLPPALDETPPAPPLPPALAVVTLVVAPPPPAAAAAPPPPAAGAAPPPPGELAPESPPVVVEVVSCPPVWPPVPAVLEGDVSPPPHAYASATSAGRASQSDFAARRPKAEPRAHKLS